MARFTDRRGSSSTRTRNVVAARRQNILLVSALSLLSIPVLTAACCAAGRGGQGSIETVTYVSNIYNYYITHRLLTDQQQRRDAAKAAVGRGSQP
jgi:hypothetical protein